MQRPNNLFNSKHKKMKNIRFPKYRRFSVPLQSCNGFAIPDVFSEDLDKGQAETVFFYFIVQMNTKHTSDEAKSLSVSMNALKAVRQVITAMAELSALEMTTADRKQLNETVHDFSTEVHGIIQGVISKYVKR